MGKPQKAPDRFFRLKHIGLAWSQGVAEGFTFADYVRFAKFQLCEARGYLMEDPIWEKYSDEGILVEYYAMKCSRDADFRKSVELQLPGHLNEIEDIADWMDAEIEKNQAAVAQLKKAAAQIEKTENAGEFEFTPPVAGKVAG